jgi:hypothetical protein
MYNFDNIITSWPYQTQDRSKIKNKEVETKTEDFLESKN